MADKLKVDVDLGMGQISAEAVLEEASPGKQDVVDEQN